MQVYIKISNTYQRGRGSRVAVRVPPHGPVDVDVLHEESHQQVEEEQELKQQAAVQWKLRDTGVTYRLRRDQGREGRSRQSHRITAPVWGREK